MSEEFALISELAIILIAAGVFTVISKALKQPLVLGYIIAGFLVGPKLGLVPQLSSDIVGQWAEIGVIFLLFASGLEFSFKKLANTGSGPLITAGTKLLGMFVVGILLGKAMNWEMMDCVFLGGILSLSFTSVIGKFYSDMGLNERPYCRLLFGSLVFDELIAMLMLLLLSTMAMTNKLVGTEIVLSLVKFVLFLAFCFVLGTFLIPAILRKTRKYISDEILLISCVGLCFGMVTVADSVGISSALGAFLMGSVLSETIEGERIEHLTLNIKDLFGAIFFVSVGMMVDPMALAEHWKLLIILSLVVIAGISLFATSGAVLSGSGLDNAVHVGFSMAQIGEFAFIIAGLGVTYDVLPDYLYPLIVGVSVLTTFVTPYMIKAADPVSKWLYDVLPQSFISKIDPSEEIDFNISSAEHTEWRQLLESYFIRVGIYSVFMTLILLVSHKYFSVLAGRYLTGFTEFWRNMTVTLVTVLMLSPFVYGFQLNSERGRVHARKLRDNNPRNRLPLFSLMILRTSISITFLVLAVVDNFHLRSWMVLLLIILLCIPLFHISFKSVKHFSTLEDRFLNNLNEREEKTRRDNPVASRMRDELSKYRIFYEVLTVPADFNYIGKTLREMPFRHTTGINIVKIQRGTRSILIPSGSEVIYPGDKLLAVGTRTQIDAFLSSVNENMTVMEKENDEEFSIKVLNISPQSSLAGKTLREARLRASGCMIVSILKGDKLTTNPSPETRMEAGDTVWLAGVKNSVDWLS